MNIFYNLGACLCMIEFSCPASSLFRIQTRLTCSEDFFSDWAGVQTGLRFAVNILRFAVNISTCTRLI